MTQKDCIPVSFLYLCDYVEDRNAAFDSGQWHPMDGHWNQDRSDRSGLLQADICCVVAFPAIRDSLCRILHDVYRHSAQIFRAHRINDRAQNIHIQDLQPQGLHNNSFYDNPGNNSKTNPSNPSNLHRLVLLRLRTGPFQCRSPIRYPLGWFLAERAKAAVSRLLCACAIN